MAKRTAPEAEQGDTAVLEEDDLTFQEPQAELEIPAGFKEHDGEVPGAVAQVAGTVVRAEPVGVVNPTATADANDPLVGWTAQQTGGAVVEHPTEQMFLPHELPDARVLAASGLRPVLPDSLVVTEPVVVETPAPGDDTALHNKVIGVELAGRVTATARRGAERREAVVREANERSAPQPGIDTDETRRATVTGSREAVAGETGDDLGDGTTGGGEVVEP